MQGQIDIVTPDGVVEGWCWNPQAPYDRVSVVVNVDGAEAARTIATHYREDLHAAGIGDGCYFFRVVLPADTLGHKRAHTVTLLDAGSGVTIGDPYSVRLQQALSFDDRLTALETQARLLENRVAELDRGHGDSQAEVFAVIGAFFERISHDLARGFSPAAGQQLSDTIRAVTRTYSRLTFPAAEHPAIGVVVEAAHPLPDLHACLTALRLATPGSAVQVTVLDTGAFDETALLPSFARGLRYVRAVAARVTEWTEAAESGASPIILFLDGGAVVGDDATQRIVDRFDFNPNLAALGGYSSGPEQAMRRGAFGIMDDAFQELTGLQGEDLLPVPALSHLAFAVRRKAWAAVAGLDAAFGDDVAAAVIDLCFRLRQAEWGVMADPTLPVAIVNAPLPPAGAPRHRLSPLLEQRWLSQTNGRPIAPGQGA